MGAMDGKICVVTGAAGSIGHASARLFAAEGAHVMLVDHDAAQLAKARQSFPEAGRVLDIGLKVVVHGPRCQHVYPACFEVAYPTILGLAFTPMIDEAAR